MHYRGEASEHKQVCKVQPGVISSQIMLRCCRMSTETAIRRVQDFAASSVPGVLVHVLLQEAATDPLFDVRPCHPLMPPLLHDLLQLVVRVVLPRRESNCCSMVSFRSKMSCVPLSCIKPLFCLLVLD